MIKHSENALQGLTLPGMNILHNFQIKYLGKVSLFWYFGKSFFILTNVIKILENSNEICELLCRFYGLRVTFGEEFVCSLWEKFSWFS